MQYCAFRVKDLEKRDMPKAKSSVEIKNRRASFDYEFIETFQAGLVLTGTEIKSIRAGKASLVDAFCYFNNNELYVKNMHIAEYWWGSWGKHDPRRERKLLLTRKELTRLSRAVKEKYLQCDRGVFPLHDFFSRAMASTEESVSADRVKERLKALIDSENKKKPFSDRELTEQLMAEGIQISRRTAAKYREAMGIAGASGRKSF